MQKITPCLWFDKQAEEAANLYTTIFKKSKVLNVVRYGKAGAEVSGMPEGTAMTVEFELDGQKFVGLNGGPIFKFSEAISFMVACKDQEEIDYFWEKLTANGGQESQCGWLKDKFGVSWQIIPKDMEKLMLGKNPEETERKMQAMLSMKKLNIESLKNA